jgi:reactive intermediate/imine deaminase
MNMPDNSRRTLLKGAAAAVAAAGTVNAQTTTAQTTPAKKVYQAGPKPAKPPAYSTAVSYGSLLFVSGMIYRQEGDIKVQTESVMNDIRKQLEAAGSSMEKVLKCNVFLANIKDLPAMNEVYTGKFGGDPPARTTVAVSGIPANSLIEMDVVAYI